MRAGPFLLRKRSGPARLLGYVHVHVSTLLCVAPVPDRALSRVKSCCVDCRRMKAILCGC